jgi:small ligand-binding sensory domain FIST
VRFASAFSTHPELRTALETATGAALDELDARVDLACLLLSTHYINESFPPAASALAELTGELVERLGTTNLIGCTAESVVANQYELERQPALSLWLASFDQCRIDTFPLEFRPQGSDAGFLGWPERLLEHWPIGAALIVLGDPFSFPLDVFLNRVNEDRPGVPVYGGMASGASRPGMSQLICGSGVFNQGVVVACISGDFKLRSIVSQGCRPIGSPMVVTRAEGNRILQLGGKPALEQLKSIFATLPVREQQMVNRGLHLGRAISEYRDRFQMGDFVIRNVIGIDAESGGIAIADMVRTGQTVQFQIRDGETADIEFRQMLNRVAATARPQAGLLFTCNGRGTRLFSQKHHDAGLIRETLGAIPIAGLFAAGEAGPVAGTNFLHGFTASLVLFE